MIKLVLIHQITNMQPTIVFHELYYSVTPSGLLFSTTCSRGFTPACGLFRPSAFSSMVFFPSAFIREINQKQGLPTVMVKYNYHTELSQVKNHS